MPIDYINPEHHMAPAGQYSHAAIVSSGRLAFVAGQVALNAQGAVVGLGDVEAQYGQALRNVAAVVQGLGAAMTDIAELRTFLVDTESLEPFRRSRERVYHEYFPDGAYPPNTLVVVSGLAHPDLKVEVAATVSLPD